MVFRKIKYGGQKEKIRALLRTRQALKQKAWRHQSKIDYHKEKIKVLEEKFIVEVEAQLNKYLGDNEIL